MCWILISCFVLLYAKGTLFVKRGLQHVIYEFLNIEYGDMIDILPKFIFLVVLVS